jgi:dihydrodipicolinate synthase/N-acetylneuraminate lyase
MTTFTAQGIIAAPVLPMKPNFAIDWPSLRSYLAWLAKQRPTAIAMNMDASEGPSLSRDEMLEVIRVSRAVIKDACPLVSGLIAGSTADAVAFGKQLKAAGAQGLAIFPPFPTFLGNPVPTRMIFGCDGALIGFACTATDQLIRMHRAVTEKDFDTAFEIWRRLGPLARYAWRAPIRDYRPRMKEVLVMQGLIRHAAVRPPQLPVSAAERAELRRLAKHAGLI